MVMGGGCILLYTIHNLVCLCVCLHNSAVKIQKRVNNVSCMLSTSLLSLHGYHMVCIVYICTCVYVRWTCSMHCHAVLCAVLCAVCRCSVVQCHHCSHLIVYFCSCNVSCNTDTSFDYAGARCGVCTVSNASLFSTTHSHQRLPGEQEDHVEC